MYLSCEFQKILHCQHTASPKLKYYGNTVFLFSPTCDLSSIELVTSNSKQIEVLAGLMQTSLLNAKLLWAVNEESEACKGKV